MKESYKKYLTPEIMKDIMKMKSAEEIIKYAAEKNIQIDAPEAEKLLEKFCPDLSDEDISRIIYIFFPFMFGIYPYTDVTEKQMKAMSDAGIEFQYQSVYDIVYKCLIALLKGIR